MLIDLVFQDFYDRLIKFRNLKTSVSFLEFRRGRQLKSNIPIVASLTRHRT